MLSIGEFAAMLERASVRAKEELAVPTEIVMVAAEKIAKEAIGTYEFGWPQLAESTQAERTAKGYSSNDPLLRDGTLKGSISHEVELTMTGAEGVLGSGEKTALYHEFGTSRNLPPRPFLSEALMRSTPLIEKEFGEFLMTIISGRSAR
jgi:phage gpG-like protein